MQGTFCIDKRIGYLALFAVPLMVLTIFSLIVNSQKVSQNSRAEERVVVSMVPTMVPTIISANEVCFGRKIEGGFMVREGKIITNLPMRIYDSNKNLRTLLHNPSINLPLTLTETFYVGIQGENADLDKIIESCRLL